MNIHDSRLRWRFTAARLVMCVILVATPTLELTTPERAAIIITHAEVVSYCSMFPDWPFIIYSVDSMGNSEVPQPPLTIKIDLTPPVLNVWVDRAGCTRLELFTVHFGGYDPEPGSVMASFALAGARANRSTQ
jgi:hypothetical protein